jgi:hypothetical protein
MPAEICELLRQYYQSRWVRKRMAEFLGRTGRKSPTAVFIVGNDGYSDFDAPVSPRSLPKYLDKGWDVARSMWDRQSLIADLDLDYENFDSAEVAYLDPKRTFALTEPVFSVASQVLANSGIQSLDLVSGRGFHLVWRVGRSSEAFHCLTKIGRVPSSLMAVYRGASGPDGAGVDLDLANAFAGLGMVLEFAVHRVLRAAAPRCPVPIQVTAIEVGPGKRGREILSLDLSAYGDPLHRRHVRMPFSAYLKPRKLVWALGENGVHGILPLFQIPLAGMPLPQAIAVMGSEEQARKLSKSASAEIPDQSDGTLALIDDYSGSELAAFHERFYSMEEHDARRSVATKAKGLVAALPQCARWILENPNDWLLKPAALQHLARVLTAFDWHPREVAELIRSRYDADCGWGDTWARHDPSWRAIFYTRLFTGLIATRTDQLIDLNCVSHKEKGYCTIPECYGNLVTYRDMILNRSTLWAIGRLDYLQDVFAGPASLNAWRTSETPASAGLRSARGWHTSIITTWSRSAAPQSGSIS